MTVRSKGRGRARFNAEGTSHKDKPACFGFGYDGSARHDRIGRVRLRGAPRVLCVMSLAPTGERTPLHWARSYHQRIPLSAKADSGMRSSFLLTERYLSRNVLECDA